MSYPEVAINPRAVTRATWENEHLVLGRKKGPKEYVPDGQGPKLTVYFIDGKYKVFRGDKAEHIRVALRGTVVGWGVE